jgi:hypothetical protein
VLPNPLMQLTGRTVPSSARALAADGDQRNEGLCGRGLEGLQLISHSLGRLARPEPLAEHDPVESSATSTEAQAL